MHRKDLFRMPAEVRLRGPVFGGTAGCSSQGMALKKEINNRGFTLLELIVVISITGILAAALFFLYDDWMGRYKVEKATRELYVDLMNARCMAMTRNCNHFADFNSPEPPVGYGTYRIAEDTDGDDEGDDDADGIIDNSGHTFLPSFQRTVEYPITNNFISKIINFDRKGTVQPSGAICFFTDNDPDYDCIIISPTRIIMGKLKKQPADGGECNSANCVKK